MSAIFTDIETYCPNCDKPRTITYRNHEAESAEARAAQAEAERDEARQRADILDRACVSALNERDEARREVERLNRFLTTIVNIGDTKRHAAFDGERYREMRHCANQALNTQNESYEP